MAVSPPPLGKEHQRDTFIAKTHGPVGWHAPSRTVREIKRRGAASLQAIAQALNGAASPQVQLIAPALPGAFTHSISRSTRTSSDGGTLQFAR
jgi:hypothetical protein